MMILYGLILIFFSLYSFVLIDPNITFFNLPIWKNIQESLVNIGYYQRETSWQIYLILIAALFFFHLYFVGKHKRINPVQIATLVGVIFIVSYPFLSHDFFN